jgi:hypothetical protein
MSELEMWIDDDIKSGGNKLANHNVLLDGAPLNAAAWVLLSRLDAINADQMGCKEHLQAIIQEYVDTLEGEIK